MTKYNLIFCLLLTLSSTPTIAANYLSEDCFTTNYKLTIYKPNATRAEYQLVNLKNGNSINFSQKNYLVNNFTDTENFKVKILHESQVTSKEKGMMCAFLTETWQSKLNIKVTAISRKIASLMNANKGDSMQFSCKSTMLSPVSMDYNRQMMKTCDIAPQENEANFNEIFEE